MPEAGVTNGKVKRSFDANQAWIQLLVTTLQLPPDNQWPSASTPWT
jgi:hypothetical protein